MTAFHESTNTQKKSLLKHYFRKDLTIKMKVSVQCCGLQMVAVIRLKNSV